MRPWETNLTWRKLPRNTMTDPRLQYIRRRISPQLRHKVYTVYFACLCLADDNGIVFITDPDLFIDYCDLDDEKELTEILDWFTKKNIIFMLEPPDEYSSLIQIVEWLSPYPDRQQPASGAERTAQYRDRIQSTYRIPPESGSNTEGSTEQTQTPDYIPPADEGDAAAALGTVRGISNDAAVSSQIPAVVEQPPEPPGAPVDFDKLRQNVVTIEIREEEIKKEKETKKERDTEKKSEREKKNSEIPCTQVNDFAEPESAPVKISGSEIQTESDLLESEFKAVFNLILSDFLTKNPDFILDSQEKKSVEELSRRFVELASEKKTGKTKCTAELLAIHFLSWYDSLTQAGKLPEQPYIASLMLTPTVWDAVFRYLKELFSPVTSTRSAWYKYGAKDNKP